MTTEDKATACRRCDGRGTLWANANYNARVLCMTCGGTGKTEAPTTEQEGS